MPHKDPAAKTAYMKQYAALNKEKLKAQAKERYAKNEEQLKIKAKERYAANREQAIARSLETQKEKPGEAAARHNLSRLKKLNRVPVWTTLDDIWLMQEVYILAKDRIRTTGMRWDVDHIYPIKGKHVSGLHVPSNLRVVPYRVNKDKRNRLVDDCGIIPSDFL